MELETINKLYLELSQVTTATTGREIELERENKHIREAAQEKINADLDCWAANNLQEHVIANTRNEAAHDALVKTLKGKT